MKLAKPKVFNSLEKFFEKYPIIILALSAIATSLIFLSAKLFFLSFFGLIPFFYFLDKTKKSKNIFLGSWFFGFVYYGIVLAYLFSTLFLFWTILENKWLGIFTIISIWLPTVFGTSLIIGIFGLLYKKIPDNKKSFLVPAAWIVCEYLVAFVSVIIWTGQESLIGPYWAMGSLGYVFSMIPGALYFAKTLGLYGASFIIVYINFGIYSIYKAKDRKKEFIKIIFPLILILVILSLIHEIFFKVNFKETGTKLASVIQTYSTALDDALPGLSFGVDGQSKQLFEKVNSNSEVIVLPEGGFLDEDDFNAKKNYFSKKIFSKDVFIIGNISPNFGESNPVKVVKYFPATGDELVIGQKTLLAPFGEYFPFITEKLGKIIGSSELVKSLKSKYSYKRGDNFYYGNSKESVIICSSVFAPSLWEDASRRGAEIFILPASQWFFKGSSFYNQSQLALRFFAAENDKWMLVAANGGSSYIINENGHLESKSKSANHEEIIEDEVVYRSGKTLASVYQNWTVWLSVISISIFLFLKNFNKKNKNSIF